MKIAIITNDTTYTYNLRAQLIRGIRSAGHEVLVISQPRTFQAELKQLGARLCFIDNKRQGKNPFQDIRLVLRYIAILKEEHPDAVLSFNIKPNIYGGLACRLLRIRFFPNISGLGKALEFSGPMQKLTTALYRFGVAQAETIFFQNHANQDFFERHKLISSKTKAVLLPGSGVDLSRYSPLPYPTGSAVIFLFVSRILKEKGIDYYLHAAKEIRKTHPEAEFHVCGMIDDPQYYAILNTAVASGDIVYHGEQLHMQPFYEIASCVVHPSYYPEGMSITLLEAAACARPIITTNRSGCMEAVDDGRTGFIVPTQNEAELVDAIMRFLTMSWPQRKEMGRLGREKIVREFDRSIVAKHYMQAIFSPEIAAKEQTEIGL